MVVVGWTSHVDRVQDMPTVCAFGLGTLWRIVSCDRFEGGDIV